MVNQSAETPSAESLDAKADEFKQQANQKFKEQHYQEAIDLYTKALEVKPSPVVYANRAFAHIKFEEYGSAILDATEAIALDPTYVKGYYRRADANMVLGKHREALRDFKFAEKGAKADPDLKRKLAACQKEIQRQRFAAALSRGAEDELVSATIDLNAYSIDSSYAGPRMAVKEKGKAEEGAESKDADKEEEYEVTREFIVAMMQHFKDQKKIPLRYVLQIILEFQEIVKQLPSLVDIEVPDGRKITVCGDTHGQFYDLLHILDLNGPPSAENPYVFNGDFVDRGSWSVEVIVTLMAWKVLDPTCMHLTRGNHEATSLNKIYGFEGEVKAKYNLKLMDVFRETFCWLPLSYCLNHKVLVLHGGLFKEDGVKLEDIRAVDRFREPPDSGIMCDCLWSDPQPQDGRAPSKRGCGIQFGPDVTKEFCENNGLELIIRSHEVKDGGYEIAHNGKCVTVFSAPNYCDNMGNQGAFITLNADMVPHFTQFSAVPHPEIKPMAYADMSLFGGLL